MDINKLKKLGFKSLKNNIEKIRYKNKYLKDYKNFGRTERPFGSVVLSKIKIKEVDNYEFIGLCADMYFNKGFLFIDKREFKNERL